MIGKVGYEWPTSPGARHLSFDDPVVATIENLTVRGQFGAGNLLLIDPEHPPVRPIVLHVHDGTENCLVVLDRDLTLHADLHLYRAGQTVVLGGGIPVVGHGGRVTAKLFSDGQALFWGRGSTSNGTTVHLVGDDRRVVVGEDCMFAANVNISTHDMHAVIDLERREQTNSPQDVLIEPHVWLAQHATVSKGVTVGLGSVVSAKAMVARSLPRLCLAGGIPARVIKQGHTWDRRRVMDPGTIDRVLDLVERVPTP